MKSPAPQSVLRGTVLLFIGKIISRVLGLVREVLSASLFGAGMAMDCFNLSFTIVTSMRLLFSEQFHTPITPVYFQRKRESGEEAALLSLRQVTTRLNLITLIICIIVFLFAAQIVRAIAPGFDEQKIRLSATMARWFAVGGAGIILYRYYTGIFTCFFQYTAVSFTPLLMNVFAIGGMVFFAVKAGVVSLASGMALGYLAHLATLMFFLPKQRRVLTPSWNRGDPGVKKYTLLLMPLFLAVSVEQVQLLVDRALASGLPEGDLSAQGYALRLVRMFTELLVGTLGTAIFPLFSSLAASEKKKEFARNFSLAFQGVAFVVAIAGAIGISLSLPITRVILERGAFTSQDSAVTAGLIGYYAVAYGAQALFIIVVRGFHAYGNTRTPVYTTVASVIVMIIADFLLIGPMGINGLALALAIGYCLNLLLVFLLFSRFLPGKEVLLNIRNALLAIILAFLFGWGLRWIWELLDDKHLVDHFLNQVISITLLGVVACSIFVILLHFLRIPAVKFLHQKIRHHWISHKTKNQSNDKHTHL